MTEEKTQQEKDHKQLLVLLDGLQPTHQPFLATPLQTAN
jgi:hypothetical protein